jgi:hypothetical protein
MLTATHVKITNISGFRQVIQDMLLPNGQMEVEHMQVTYIPVQVYNNVWRRYDDWMRDLDSPDNKQYLDMIVEQINEPLICPHCGKCFDEEIEAMIQEEFKEKLSETDEVIPVAKVTKPRTKRKRRTCASKGTVK